MELLGRESADVVSVSCSPASSTTFATLSGKGSLTMWDTRLKRRNYLSIANPNTATGAEATELRYYQDRHVAVALCGNTVQLYDTRKTLSVVAEYAHPTECVGFLKTALPSEAETLLLIDEDGGMFPLSLMDGTRRDVLEAYVLGRPYSLPGLEEGGWGELDNYCSGLHCVDITEREERDTTTSHSSRVLFAVGMDGNGALYGGAEEEGKSDDATITSSSNSCGAAIRRTPFCIMEAPQERQTAQMVNPPLVNCTAVCGSLVAAGRADGTYSIYSVSSDGPEALLEAPGHAVNGLCLVDWLTSNVLLTTSLCGEVTGWNVGALLAAEVDEEEEEGELPDVVTAFAHREVAGCQLATVNCGDRLGDSSYVFGDTMGGVTLARVEL